MLAIVGDVIIEYMYIVRNFMVRNIKNFAICIDVVLPFLMLYIGEYVYSIRQDFFIGSELMIPIMFIVISSIMKGVYKKQRNYDSFPVPFKKFTHVDSEGVILADKTMYVDMVLYISQVEDYLERHGKM